MLALDTTQLRALFCFATEAGVRWAPRPLACPGAPFAR
jgi:hypothetical protein